MTINIGFVEIALAMALYAFIIEVRKCQKSR